jgi:hypothetical protein
MLDKPETDELDRLDRFAGRPTRRRPTRRLTRRRATRFAGQMSFTNNGAAGHNAVIRDVSATIELGDRKIEQYWQSFATVTRQSREFMVEVKETAHPFVVNGSGAVSYMVTFSPRVKDCIEQISTTIGCHRAPTL